MSQQGWMECIATAQADGTALSAFTTAASILPSQAKHTFPADDWFIGKSIGIKAAGRISNVITAQPTFTFEFRLGPTSAIVAFTTGALLTSTTAHTTVPWTLEAWLTCRSVGSGTLATLIGQAMVQSRAFLDAGATADITTLGHPTLLAPETTPAVGTGFDSTVANVADLFVACSASAAGNAIQLHQYKLYAEN